MGGRGSSSGGGNTYASSTSINTNGTVIQPQVALDASQATQANNTTFKSTATGDFHDLYNGRQYYLSQTFDVDTLIAIQNYISPTTESGSMYSMSQNMNYALANGQRLTANQQYVYDGMMAGMHNLGYNVNLYRYDHDAMINNLLANAGLSGDYENYSEAQLKSALVGTTVSEKKFLSTSYNDFKNASDPSTFTSRAVRIVYKCKADTQVLMTGDAQANARVRNFLGEIVMAPKQSARITSVRYTGNRARRQGTQSYTRRQIEIIMEVG